MSRTKSNKVHRNRCISFLEANGYKKEEENDEYISFFRDTQSSCIDISEDEIVFIGEEGDYLHIVCDIFALIGALIHYRQIAVNYKWVTNEVDKNKQEDR